MPPEITRSAFRWSHLQRGEVATRGVDVDMRRGKEKKVIRTGDETKIQRHDVATQWGKV